MLKIDFWQIFVNTIKLAIAFWPLWVVLLAVIIIKLFFYWLDLEIDNWHIRRKFAKGEKWRSDQDLVRWLRGMKPSEFEEYIADLFRRLGYKTEAIGGSHDEGVDVIAEKNGVKHYIQCKKYFSKHQVGSPEIREFYGAIADHLVNGEAWYITTNKFTPEAENFAKDKPIILINSFDLIKYIHQAENKGFDSKHQIEINLKCPACGSVLVKREGRFGEFLGCLNYPKCTYTQKI